MKRLCHDHTALTPAPDHAAGRGLHLTALCAAVVTALGLATPSGLLAQETAKPAAPSAPAPIKATLRIDDTYKDIDLVGREKNTLFYRPRGGPEGASMTLKIESVTEGEFVLKYDAEAASKALLNERWSEAASILIPVVTPLLPYLDINDNNGASLALEAGLSLIKAARGMPSTNEASQARITAVYQRAYSILKPIASATWSPDAELAALRAVQCLIALGDVSKATREIEDCRDPSPGDESYGLYWLTTSQLLYSQGKTKEAMSAAVKSSVFDNKNVETFPDALFMTGRCYEDMLEWYRARDVYYEIAKLFPGIGHGATAREKLKALMEKGLTKAKESSPIEAVFFGLDEDVNASVNKLLDSTGKPVEDDDKSNIEEDAQSVGEAAIKAKEKKKEGVVPK